MNAEKTLKQYEADKNLYIDQLKGLVKIPSVSFSGFDMNEVKKSAESVAKLFTDIGLENVKLLYTKDNPRPYVYADWLHAEGALTLLLYAHHDVQPPGKVEKWKTPPFEPVQKGDRLFGRGAADDKAGVIVHAATIASYLKTEGKLPVNVKLLIEGEEEIGSPGLEGFLEENKDLLKADVMVLTDTDNYSTERPGLVTALRGIVVLDIEVRALDHSLHSGMWGGPIPDPAMALSKMVASLVDHEGNIVVKGLMEDVQPLSPQQKKQLQDLGENEDEFREQTSLLKNVPLLKTPGTIRERIWFRPSLTINAMEASSRKQAANIIVDSAWARVSVRIVPNMNPKKVFDLMVAHLKQNCPFGLVLEIKEDGLANWWKTETTHPVFETMITAMKEAWNADPVLMGVGGSIPFVQPFSNALGGAPALLIGVEDPYTNAHSENESLHLGVLDKSIKTCIRFYASAGKLKF